MICKHCFSSCGRVWFVTQLQGMGGAAGSGSGVWEGYWQIPLSAESKEKNSPFPSVCFVPICPSACSDAPPPSSASGYCVCTLHILPPIWMTSSSTVTPGSPCAAGGCSLGVPELLLYTSNFSLPFILHTDASNRGLGAMLSQQVRVGEVDHPVVYISRKLSEQEASAVGSGTWRRSSWPSGGRSILLLITSRAIHSPSLQITPCCCGSIA